MQNFKNFKLIEPSIDQLKKYASFAGTPLILESEDGQDWYECQKLFSDDTVKIQYDSDGIIRGVIDKPIPERGNIYAVSMLWPVNASVAELALDDYPDGVTLDGTWKYDEETRNIYQDADIVSSQVIINNTRQLNKLLSVCAVSAFPLQSRVDVGCAIDEQVTALAELKQYVIDLTNPAIVDLTQSPLQLPPAPLSLQVR
ncbi:tail fiber assembly protein [Salmonella enterica subsp. enterica]|nr:tail fiber assembly protein [Salmonella enterica subsp. enterica]EAW9773822.1 tail fiber assembly protein [Salmonella enterica]